MLQVAEIDNSWMLQRASQEVQKAEKYREKMGAVQQWLTKIGLPHDLCAKIRQYYSEVWSCIANRS